ncbi:MAG: aminotransferase class V-fold PLP-dependent enzyme [Planctomycetes bacterium]|nr:aminotransferase class V-fold PLP-dependent enzyme [Planctomycetota bacterium]
MQRLYLDNAATTFPKPPGVSEALRDYIENIGASAGRGAYREAMESSRLLTQTRDLIRKLFNARGEDHVIFTLNGTDALNMAIKSVVRDGDHVVTTAMDHNSVLRPLEALHAQRGVEWTIVAADASTTIVDPAAIEAAITARTVLVAVNHASNVTGAVQDIAAIGEICRCRGVLLLIDAAQSAGHLPIDVSRLPVDFLATPGHKGLLGPLGTGVLLIRAELEGRLQTVREGGTGSASEQMTQPEFMPDRFESGSHNAVGLAGLHVALQWLLERGVESVRKHEVELCERFAERLNAIGGLTWFGPREMPRRVGVFSICVEGYEPAELSAILEDQFGLLTRSGLHCAPLAHQTIGTADRGGTTRVSFGPFISTEDADRVAETLEHICATATTQH